MGIFANQSKLWTRYRAQITFRDKIMGGVPRNTELVEGWIRSKSGITDEEEIKSLVRRTMIENGTWRDDMTDDEIQSASKQVAALKQTTGFKRDAVMGLFIESRQLKAGIKEATNILFPWTGGSSKQKEAYGIGKSMKSFLAERVFVSPDRLYLGQAEPDDVELMIGQVSGPQGRRSTLGYHEYVAGATIDFDVLVAHDVIKQEWWVDIWSLMEENGLGALRSQGHGKFDINAWDKVSLAINAPGPARARSRASETNTTAALASD